MQAKKDKVAAWKGPGCERPFQDIFTHQIATLQAGMYPYQHIKASSFFMGFYGNLSFIPNGV